MSRLLKYPGLIFLAWSAWLSLEYWVLGDLSYLHIHDNADQVIPLYLWLTQSLGHLAGSLVLPVMSGVDRLCNCSWISLFHFPFLLFPAWLAHGVVIGLQRFVAGYFSYRFLRDYLHVPPFVATVAGMAYTVINFEYGELRLMHSLNEPGLPLLLWFMCRIPLASWPKLAGLSVVMALLCGFSMDPVSALPFFLPTAFLLALILREDLIDRAAIFRLTAAAALFSFVCILPTLVSMLAIVNMAPLAHRTDWQQFVYGLAGALRQEFQPVPFTLVRWCGALLLGPVWLFTFRRRNRENWGVLTLLIIGFVLGPVLQTLMVQIHDHIGFLRGFNFSRFLRVGPFALLSMAALGLRALAGRENGPEEAGGPRPARSIAVGLSLIVFGMIFHESLDMKKAHWQGMRLEGKHWRALYQNRDVKALADEIRGRPVRVATAGAYHAFHPMYLLPYDVELADGYLPMYPNRYQKFWDMVVGKLIDNEPELKGHFSLWGSRVYLFHSRKPENEGITKIPFADWYDLDLLSLANVRYFVSRKPLEDARLKLRDSQVTSLMLKAWSEKKGLSRLKGYLKGENPGPRLFVYENPEALDRFFCVNRIRLFETEETLLNALRDLPVSQMKEEALAVRTDLPADMAPALNATSARVQVASYAPDKATVAIESDGVSLLVISNLYYPWWTARINGEVADIFPVFGTFQGLVVPEGSSRVELDYKPPYAW